jgi:hypothetical protein
MRGPSKLGPYLKRSSNALRALDDDELPDVPPPV